MTLEILPCMVETVNYQEGTYESLRGRGEVKAKKDEIIKAGIEEKHIDDFREDAESGEGDVCGDNKRLEAYLEILSVLGLCGIIYPTNLFLSIIIFI